LKYFVARHIYLEAKIECKHYAAHLNPFGRQPQLGVATHYGDDLEVESE
jgi:hypothetical protein